MIVPLNNVLLRIVTTRSTYKGLIDISPTVKATDQARVEAVPDDPKCPVSVGQYVVYDMHKAVAVPLSVDDSAGTVPDPVTKTDTPALVLVPFDDIIAVVEDDGVPAGNVPKVDMSADAILAAVRREEREKDEWAYTAGYSGSPGTGYAFGEKRNKEG